MTNARALLVASIRFVRALMGLFVSVDAATACSRRASRLRSADYRLPSSTKGTATHMPRPGRRRSMCAQWRVWVEGGRCRPPATQADGMRRERSTGSMLFDRASAARSRRAGSTREARAGDSTHRRTDDDRRQQSASLRRSTLGRRRAPPRSISRVAWSGCGSVRLDLDSGATHSAGTPWHTDSEGRTRTRNRPG